MFQPLADQFRARAASGHDLNGAPLAGGSNRYPEMAAAGHATVTFKQAGSEPVTELAFDAGRARRECGSRRVQPIRPWAHLQRFNPYFSTVTSQAYLPTLETNAALEFA